MTWANRALASTAHIVSVENGPLFVEPRVEISKSYLKDASECRSDVVGNGIARDSYLNIALDQVIYRPKPTPARQAIRVAACCLVSDWWLSPARALSPPSIDGPDVTVSRLGLNKRMRIQPDLYLPTWLFVCLWMALLLARSSIRPGHLSQTGVPLDFHVSPSI